MPVWWMSALPPKADIAECDRHVRFVPIADIEQRSLGTRYRQNRHDLYGISGKDREVRMLLEHLGGSVMRFRANDRVSAHQVANAFDAALANTPTCPSCSRLDPVQLFFLGASNKDAIVRNKPGIEFFRARKTHRLGH
jgi:hypothetical protein